MVITVHLRRAFLLAALLVPMLAVAQEKKFSVDANYLMRGEIRDGGLSVSDEGEAGYARFVLSRTRIGASFEHDWLSARLVAQHAGTWGSIEGNSLSMNEAWVRFGTKGFFAKVGRQSLSYDDQRIFGLDDWSMTGISHDAVKVGFEGGAHKVHLIGAYNQDVANMDKGGTRFSGGLQPYKGLGAAWYHVDISKVGLSALFMDLGLQSTEDLKSTFHQHLAGAFVSWQPKRFGLEGAYYHQWGKEQSGLPVNAWMASVKATARISDMLSARAGYDYLSGDEDFAVPGQGMIGLTRHEVVNGFSSLYGSNHKFYGAMDFFYVSTYVSGFTPGLQNLYAGVTFKPVEKLSVDAAYHYFSTAVQVKDHLRALGHEVELTASWRFSKDVSLSAGYSFMQGTETMSALKRTADNNRLHWGWVMLLVTPRFFETKW